MGFHSRVNADRNVGVPVNDRSDECRITELVQQLQTSPDDLTLLCRLSEIYERTNLLPQALKVCETLLRLAPKNFNFRYHQADLLSKLNYADQALELLVRLHRESPADLAVINALGRCCYDLGMYDEAARYCQEYLALAPDSPAMRNNDARCHVSSGRIEEACAVLQESLKATPRDAEAHALLGVTYALLGRKDDALRERKFAVESCSDPSTIGELLRELDDLIDADPGTISPQYAEMITTMLLVWLARARRARPPAP